MSYHRLQYDIFISYITLFYATISVYLMLSSIYTTVDTLAAVNSQFLHLCLNSCNARDYNDLIQKLW